MNPRLKQAIQFVVFFGLGLGLMWWQFSGLEPQEKADFFHALKTANYGWFVLAVFVGMLAHLSRALRWQQLLHPLGHKTGLGNRFYAVMIGYLANYGIPRSGEVIRCGILKNSNDVPFSESFGTVVVERIVDMLCLLVVFFVVLLTQFAQLSKIWTKYIADPAAQKFATLSGSVPAIVVLSGGLIILFGGTWLMRKKIRAFLSSKLGNFFGGFKKGLMAVRRVPNPGVFIFHSLFIWTGYLASMYIVFFCFSATSGLSLNMALILLLFGTFGVAFTPGGIGAYQVLVANVMVYTMKETHNVTMHMEDAMAFAWLSWGAQVATVILFCGVAALMKPYLNRITR